MKNKNTLNNKFIKHTDQGDLDDSRERVVNKIEFKII